MISDDLSPCDTVTCHNDGICIDDYDVATCECKPGFIGLDYSTDSCDHMGCWEGECKNGECQCPDGFFGDYCENRGTSCGDSFCFNGNCTESVTCLCDHGFSGNFCEIDQCDLIHCGNYGICVQGFCECEIPHCEYPFYGQFCQYGPPNSPESGAKRTNLSPAICLTLLVLFSF